MPARALTDREVAGELGRSADWLHRNWRGLVAGKKMPAPIHEQGALVWPAAHFYAWLDRDLPPALRASAAAFRAALDAAHAPRDPIADLEIEKWREHLNGRFVG